MLLIFLLIFQMDRIFYILIKEQAATQKERGFNMSRGAGETTHVVEGSLWYDCPPSSEVDDYRTLDKTLKLQSIEYEDLVMNCGAQDVVRLTTEILERLLALNSSLDRIKVFQDTSWIEEALEMEKETIVFVLKMPGLPERAPAKIRYRGPLKNRQGLWFGVELSAVCIYIYIYCTEHGNIDLCLLLV